MHASKDVDKSFSERGTVPACQVKVRGTVGLNNRLSWLDGYDSCEVKSVRTRKLAVTREESFEVQCSSSF